MGMGESDHSPMEWIRDRGCSEDLPLRLLVSWDEVGMKIVETTTKTLILPLSNMGYLLTCSNNNRTIPTPTNLTITIYLVQAMSLTLNSRATKSLKATLKGRSTVSTLHPSTPYIPNRIIVLLLTRSQGHQQPGLVTPVEGRQTLTALLRLQVPHQVDWETAIDLNKVSRSKRSLLPLLHRSSRRDKTLTITIMPKVVR